MPVPGADRLWRPATHWVIVGELHGTAEIPDAFTNLVCLAAASSRPVTVALEYSSDWQSAIDAFLASDGGPAAQATLMTLPVWHQEMQDGRGSTAFRQMLDRLRVMKRDGMIVGVVATDVGRATPPVPTRDAAMARAWTAIPTADDGIVVALAGNVHAMRHPWVLPGNNIVTAGSLMPVARTMTVNVVGNGGQAWNCQADGCRGHASGPARTAAAGIGYATAPTDL